jgi:hypothetical protein
LLLYQLDKPIICSFLIERQKMSILRIIAAIYLLLLAQLPTAGAVLDWSAVTWTASSLSATYDVDGDSKNDVTITISGDTSALVSGHPSIGTSLQGGLGSADQALLLRVDFANTSQSITVTVTFLNDYVGATDVGFSLFDVDADQVGASPNYRYRDHLSSLSATGDNGLIAAALTAGSANSIAGSGTNQTVTGNSLANDTGAGSGAGNVSVNYGTNNVNEFTFTLGNTGNIISGGDPEEQIIALHDIQFKPKVPEVGTTLVAVVVCTGLVGLRQLYSRRQAKA